MNSIITLWAKYVLLTVIEGVYNELLMALTANVILKQMCDNNYVLSASVSKLHLLLKATSDLL